MNIQNIYQIIISKTEKIKNFILFSDTKEKKYVKFRNKILKIFPFGKEKETMIYLVKENKSKEQLLIEILNFNLQLIPLVIQQEYKILNLQNLQEVEYNEFLYELLYLGLQNKFLEFTDTKPMIEAFYQTKRITYEQYTTLIRHYYLEDKEYEEECKNL